jgi:thiosulfate/3-mercaptopyruvate sulfurtransferase
VVDETWLARRADVVLADVRWYLDGRSGRDAYDRGHLPGAVFVDLERWLAGAAARTEGRHPLPDPAVFARGMASAGIGQDDVVVAYDDAGGTVAARLVWLLRATGHRGDPARRGAASLDRAPDDGGPGAPARPVRPAPLAGRLLVAPDEVPGLVEHGVVLLDARAAERYRGEVEPVDPRAGHVPGARSLPAASTLAEDGRLLPVEQLRRRLAAVGVVDGADVVASCGSGVTACHTLLVLEHAGLGRGRLFPGSFSAWSADPDRPVSTGDA